MITEITTDWRFAELVAATCVDQTLAHRYADNPRTVLAEFGIELAAGAEAPSLPTEDGVVIDILGRLDVATPVARFTICMRVDGRDELAAA